MNPNDGSNNNFSFRVVMDVSGGAPSSAPPPSAEASGVQPAQFRATVAAPNYFATPVLLVQPRMSQAEQQQQMQMQQQMQQQGRPMCKGLRGGYRRHGSSYTRRPPEPRSPAPSPSSVQETDESEASSTSGASSVSSYSSTSGASSGSSSSYSSTSGASSGSAHDSAGSI